MSPCAEQRSRRPTGRGWCASRPWRTTWNAMRVGNVRLDEAGDHVDRRALRGEDQVDAGGARLLRERAISSSTFLPTTIIRSASSSITTTICGSSCSGCGSAVVERRADRQRVPELLCLGRPCGCSRRGCARRSSTSACSAGPSRPTHQVSAFAACFMSVTTGASRCGMSW